MSLGVYNTYKGCILLVNQIPRGKERSDGNSEAR